MRHTPFLTFDLDKSMDEADQILRLIDSLTPNDHESRRHDGLLGPAAHTPGGG